MRFAAALLALTVGCSSDRRHVSFSGYGIQVEIREDVTEADHASILAWVDLRFEEWVTRKPAWGCEHFSDDELMLLARSKRIVVYPGKSLPWGGSEMGMNRTDTPEIDVTINYPPLVLADPLYNGIGVGLDTFDYSYGLRQLPHEWTHTARGNWHQ